MAIYDLVTLANVKTWAGVTATNDDILLGGMITDISQAIIDNLGRGSIFPLSYAETYDGQGTVRLFIKNWPVIAVASLSIDGFVIPVSPPLAANTSLIAGYVLDTVDDPSPPGFPQQISLRGYRFTRGVQNVVLNYSAGYQVTSEAAIIPGTPFTVNAAQAYGAWATDQGVTYATGAALTKVASSPALGQYAVSAGVYTFAAADSGASVLVSYGFIPAVLARACTLWVAELYAYRGHIGTTSKSLGGQETVAFDINAMPLRVDLMLQPYRRTTPI